MSVNSTVNTNVSAPTDINANRGNLPSGVYAYDMGAFTPGGGGATQAITLPADTAEIGAWCGTIAAGPTANSGYSTNQIITMTFTNQNPADWTHLNYDIVVSLVGDGDETLASHVGSACAGFSENAAGNSGQIVIRRESGSAGGAGAQLKAATILVQLRKRGVAVATA